MDGAAKAYARERPKAPTATLDVRLSLPPAFPGIARTSLLGEVTTIWEQQGMAIQWRSDATIAAASFPTLRLLVIPKYRSTEGTSGGPLTVAELLHSADGHAVAVASLENAEQVVLDAQQGRPVPEC